MNRVNRFCTILLLCLVFGGACKDANSNQTSASDKATNATENAFPILPDALATKIFEECDQLDYIFHDLPFSMSQDDPKMISTIIRYLATTPVPNFPKECSPTARLFFNSKGITFLEADLYYSENCFYYVFFEDGKAKYANPLSEIGLNFYDGVFKQAMQATNG